MTNTSIQSAGSNVSISVEIREIKRELCFDNHAVLTYKISYPRFYAKQFPYILKNINTQYEIQAKKYVMHCEKRLYKMAVEQYEYSRRNRLPVQTFEAENKVSVTYNSDCILSLYMDRYEYLGGTHGSTYRKADNWNLSRGSRVELINIFPFIRNIREYITSEITNAVERKIESGIGNFSEEYEEDIETSFDGKSFYLTDKAVVIFYQVYDIAPYAAGIPEFTFAYRRGGAVLPSRGRQGYWTKI